MTQIGGMVLGIYSLVAITVLLVVNFKRVAKEHDQGWELAALIPILIFLANSI